LGLSLHGTLVEALLYIGAAMEPVVDCRPANTCCQWCLVMTKGVVVGAYVVMEATTAEAAAAKALLLEVHALAGEGCLWLAATLLMLPSPVQSAAV
jgi:hypothetical protein